MQRLFPDNNFVAPFLVKGNRLVCAEAPGEVEAERGEPLVGPTGAWLFGKENEDGKRTGGLYRAAGIESSAVSKLNVLNCRPPKNVFPTDADARTYITKEEAEAAVQHCLKNHVNPVLADSRWSRIDILGDKALRALTGAEGGILRWRGSPLVVPATQRTTPTAIPTLHPAFLARSQELMPAVVADLKKTLDIPDEHYNVAPTIEDVRAFVATDFAFDIETIRQTGEITLVGLCANSTYAICVPFSGVYVKELQRIFANATTAVGHNCIQFDLPRLRDNGVELPAGCVVYDTMLMQHLLQPDLPHGLDFLGSFFTNKPAWKHLSGQDEALYCCRDVDVTFQCYKQLRPMLRAERLTDLYHDVQVPLARICYMLHENGFRIDPARLKAVRADLESKSIQLEKELPVELQTREVPIRKRQPAPEGTLSEKTGKPLKYVMTDSTESVTPWKSSDQLKVYLYETAKLPVQTHAKTNEATTDKCLTPGTRVLTADLLWEPVETLEIGSEIIAFDEHKTGPAGSGSRCLRHAVVTNRSDLTEPCLEIETTKGSITVSNEHGFLRWKASNGSGYHWTKAEALGVGDELGYFREPWIVDSSRDGGYLAGILDGEGSWSKYHIAFAQNRGPLLDHIREKFLERGFTLGPAMPKKGTVTETQITGEPFAALRVVGSLRPKRLLAKARTIYDGRGVWGKNSERAIVTKITNKGTSPVIGIQTSTATIIAEGFFTHNTAIPKLIRAASKMEYRTTVGEERASIVIRGLRALQNLRQIASLLSTFVQDRWEDTGVERIHASFNVHGTASGRLSSSDPNLQNIPESARYIYVPSHSDWAIFDVDFSSLENRLTAWFAQDFERLDRLAQPGFNEHKWTTSQFFGIPIEEVVKDNSKDAPYGKAKRIGHGSNYGMGPMKISRLYDMPFAEVKALCEQWKRVNAKTVEWQLATAAKAKSDGFLETPFHRRRWFYTDSAYTESLSFLPQSTGADVVFRCMIALMYDRVGWPESAVQKIVPFYRALPQPARLLVQVHDSLVGEAPLALMPEVIDTLTRVMSQPWPELAGYAIPVEPKVGLSWGEGKAWKT